MCLTTVLATGRWRRVFVDWIYCIFFRSTIIFLLTSFAKYPQRLVLISWCHDSFSPAEVPFSVLAAGCFSFFLTTGQRECSIFSFFPGSFRVAGG